MHFLGIDGGGSRTRALICDSWGKILGSGQSGPSNPMSNSADICRSNIEEAIQLAFAERIPEPIAATHWGIAGAYCPEGIDILQTIAEQIFHSSQTKISIGHDLEIALEGGLARASGVALIAGTGSACYGKNPVGVEGFCGGWGDGVDDAGSGSWIGLQALQACARQEDGRLPRSYLQSRVMDYLGLSSMNQFKQRIHHIGLSKTERGELAPMILELAQTDDPAAVNIVQRAAEELSLLVRTCSQKTKQASPHIVLTGGLTMNPYFRDVVANKISQTIARPTLYRPRLSSASGALLISLKSSGIKTTKTTLENLTQTTR